MFITGVGSAAPSRRFTQKQCWEFARSSPEIARLSPRAQAIVKRVLTSENGIESRHLVLASLEESFQLDPDTLHRRFADHAPSLAASAAKRALEQDGVPAIDLDGLIISTCTGYLCPGLTSYVSEKLGLRPDALLLDLVGQGCGAAIPNLRTAEALLASGRAAKVLSICVEVCSAAMFLDNDPGVLISACLFGDGASAAVLSATPPVRGRQIQWETAGTLLSPADRDYLRFEQRDGMLRNILARQVPELAGKYVERVLSETLTGAGLDRSQIRTWILHSGGREILSSVGQRLGLTAEDLRWSAGILREYGNLSSACVLFVLESALNGNAPAGCWWMSSFGAGFSCHGALLRVQDA